MENASSGATTQSQAGQLGKFLSKEAYDMGVVPNSMPMLYALSVSGKHIYAGTVPADEIAKRRKRNKLAKAARRNNR